MGLVITGFWFFPFLPSVSFRNIFRARDGSNELVRYLLNFEIKWTKTNLWCHYELEENAVKCILVEKIISYSCSRTKDCLHFPEFLTCFFWFVAAALGLNEEIYPLFYSSDRGNYQKVSQLKIKTSKFLWGTFERKMFVFLFPCNIIHFCEI